MRQREIEFPREAGGGRARRMLSRVLTEGVAVAVYIIFFSLGCVFGGERNKKEKKMSGLMAVWLAVWLAGGFATLLSSPLLSCPVLPSQTFSFPSRKVNRDMIHPKHQAPRSASPALSAGRHTPPSSFACCKQERH